VSATVAITSVGGTREVPLDDWLEADDEERTVVAAHDWIKALRHADVGGMPLRRRFTLRGDSLWWFAELYLHKQQVILQACRTIAALERLVERERPSAIAVTQGGRIARQVTDAFGRAHGLRTDGTGGTDGVRLRIARMDVRARTLRLAALGSRLRPRAAAQGRRPDVAAFVHRAFWRAAQGASGAESYIGPVLDALGRRLPPGGLRLVGVGPPANFRARRWWHALRRAPQAVEPIEAFAPLGALKDSGDIWRQRHAARRALEASPDIRAHGVIRGCDCWPLVREELAGIALLQWPWSARAMDEAAAALDALEPGVALTYAEAGGWGRALMLEARRRGIATAGLQHGFIYQHWLNYRHEPDEMLPDPAQPSDGGFPRPDRTLLFDAYAARHLAEAGRFPPESLEVTGSPRLDALVEAAGRLTPEAIALARASAGCRPDQALGLVVTKHKEARHVLPGLLAAAARHDIQLAIKTHPAETPDVYAAAVNGRSNVAVLPPEAPLAPLLMACRAVITVNSTVALDAAVLGVPALAVGLPNNLSPFVEAGALAGAATAGDIPGALRRILYDDQFRQQLERGRRQFLERFTMAADGRAAERSADAVLALAAQRPGPGSVS
jgi:hypothetical protein